MSGTRFLVLASMFLVVWGLVTSWIAARFGRNGFGWFVLGTVLGPLSLPALIVVVRSERRDPPRPWPVDDRGTPRGAGILVAADTLDGLLAAASIAEDRLDGPELTLALVADADASPTGGWRVALLERDVCEPFRRRLAGARGQPSVRPVRGEVLFGDPVSAVVSEVERGGHALALVRLARSKGGRRALARLAVRAPCPVLFPLAGRRASSSAERDPAEGPRGAVRLGRGSPGAGLAPMSAVGAAGGFATPDQSLLGWLPSYDQWPALLVFGLVSAGLLASTVLGRWRRHRYPKPAGRRSSRSG